LIEERQKVLQGILENGCFPALMELFIASGRAPWEQIKEGIEGYDYFIVISAGNYRSYFIDFVRNQHYSVNKSIKISSAFIVIRDLPITYFR